MATITKQSQEVEAPSPSELYDNFKSGKYDGSYRFGGIVSQILRDVDAEYTQENLKTITSILDYMVHEGKIIKSTDYYNTPQYSINPVYVQVQALKATVSKLVSSGLATDETEASETANTDTTTA